MSMLEQQRRLSKIDMMQSGVEYCEGTDTGGPCLEDLPADPLGLGSLDLSELSLVRTSVPRVSHYKKVCIRMFRIRFDSISYDDNIFPSYNVTQLDGIQLSGACVEATQISTD